MLFYKAKEISNFVRNKNVLQKKTFAKLINAKHGYVNRDSSGQMQYTEIFVFQMFLKVLNFSYQALEGEKRSELLKSNILVYCPNYLLFSHFQELMRLTPPAKVLLLV